MKKVFLILIGFLTCGYMSAQTVTAECSIKLTATPSGSYDVLEIFQVQEANADKFDNGMDAKKIMNTQYATSVNLYGVTSYWSALQIVALPNIKGLPITVKTNQSESSYKFTFTYVDGDIKLIDYYLDSVTTMTESGTYEFTADPNQTIEDRFAIFDGDYKYFRYVANGNWATICFPYKWNKMDGVDKLYTLTAKNSAGTKVALDEVAVANVVAGTPYFFLSNSANAKQAFKYKPENKAASAGSVNGLIGTFEEIAKTTEQKWVLTGNTITPAAVGSTVGQYRCYIDLDQTPVDNAAFTQQVPGRRIFNVKNTPTELEDVNANVNANRKVMIDGKLVIMKDGKMFNAQGAQL